MKRIKRQLLPLFLFALAALMTACGAEFQTFDLSQNYMAGMHIKGSSGGNAEEEEDTRKGVPAKGYYNGDLIGGAIWWARKGITIDKEEDFLVIAENIGPEFTPFGATFPPLDFKSEKVGIRISAYAEGKDGVEPTLEIHFKDGNGYKSNATPSKVTVKNTDDFAEYVFEMPTEWLQTTPEKKKVNGGLIDGLEVLINPGGDAFTGKIFIEEIKVIPLESAQ